MSVKCACGSKRERYPLYDARGIFVSYACEICETSKRSGYRPEIFTNPSYEADEPIEPEEY